MKHKLTLVLFASMLFFGCHKDTFKKIQPDFMGEWKWIGSIHIYPEYANMDTTWLPAEFDYRIEVKKRRISFLSENEEDECTNFYRISHTENTPAEWDAYFDLEFIRYFRLEEEEDSDGMFVFLKGSEYFMVRDWPYRNNSIGSNHWRVFERIN